MQSCLAPSVPRRRDSRAHHAGAISTLCRLAPQQPQALRSGQLPASIGRKRKPALLAAADGASGSGATALPADRLRALAPAVAQAQQDNELFAAIRHVQEEIAGRIVEEFGLRPAQTTATDADGAAVFNSGDGKTSILVQVYQGGEGGRVVWLAKPTSVIAPFAVGGRVNAYLASGASTAPNLDCEFYHYPLSGKLFVYLNLVPRRSLVDNPGDLERFYLTPPGAQAAEAAGGGAGSGKSMHELFLECEGDEKWEPFRTKSAYIRALTGGTCLMYQIAATSENAAVVASLARRVADVWLALAREGGALAPKTPEQKAALAHTDGQLLAYARRDPDNKKVGAVIGEEALDKMLALLAAEDSIFE